MVWFLYQRDAYFLMREIHIYSENCNLKMYKNKCITSQFLFPWSLFKTVWGSFNHTEKVNHLNNPCVFLLCRVNVYILFFFKSFSVSCPPSKVRLPGTLLCYLLPHPLVSLHSRCHRSEVVICLLIYDYMVLNNCWFVSLLPQIVQRLSLGPCVC